MEVSTSRQGPTVDSATQTFTAPNRRSEKQKQRPGKIAQLWL